jgi:hypothetical protein
MNEADISVQGDGALVVHGNAERVKERLRKLPSFGLKALDGLASE